MSASTLSYNDFIRAKVPLKEEVRDIAVDVPPSPILKGHQSASSSWLVAGGRRALFASFGLGKTVIQIDVIRRVIAAHGGRGLIVMPLGVRGEFMRDAAMLGVPVKFIRRIEEADATGIHLTNYETVRDGKLDPQNFTAVSLDEAAVLRGFGGTKTFREFMRLFEAVQFKFVATATPSPNEYIELLAYAAFLGIMDVGEAKTRFFKRDSTNADTLTIHPHKAEEFWLWVASWALFLQKPSDLGFDDTGYALPPMTVKQHLVYGDAVEPECDRGGQYMLIPDAAIGVQAASKAKRDTMSARIEKMVEIVAGFPVGEQSVIWCHLNAEQREIEKALDKAGISYVSLDGSQPVEVRETLMEKWRAKGASVFLSKLMMYGAGVNLQQAARMIYAGVNFKFAEFIQGVHRVYRFLQSQEVEIHIIYAEREQSILRDLMRKWEQHKKLVAKMTDIIQQFGLSHAAMAKVLERSIGCKRIEVSSEKYRLVNADTVEETARMPSDSVGLIVTSIPFSTQYEYSPSYNDFGHTDNDAHFWQQMDYLIAELFRVLKPGRLAAIHVKDRIIPGGVSGLGFQTLSCFGDDCRAAFKRHGFALLGTKTITTDVVRENNQTYRLGWSEQCKDGSRMGFGVPEQLILFRKPPSSRDNGYADDPVLKAKKWRVDAREGYFDEATGEYVPAIEGHWDNPEGYSRGRWQLDAHCYTRSDGNRLIRADEIIGFEASDVYKLWKKFSLETVYNFEHHVAICEAFEERGNLPATFMLMPPHSRHPDVWTDITRMLGANTLQHAAGKEQHICPLQFDIVDRAINQWSNPGDVVFDPFGGLMTVPMRAVKFGRIGWGNELNHGYFLDGCAYVKAEAEQVKQPSLFDALEAEGKPVYAEAAE